MALRQTRAERGPKKAAGLSSVRPTLRRRKVGHLGYSCFLCFLGSPKCFFPLPFLADGLLAQWQAPRLREVVGSGSNLRTAPVGDTRRESGVHLREEGEMSRFISHVLLISPEVVG